MELIHYGSSQFDRDKWTPIQNIQYRNKPKGGLWTSPVDSEFGWREWCRQEEYDDCSVFFKLKFSGRLLVIDSELSLSKLIWIIPSSGRLHWIDFEAIQKDYDAIHLTEKGERKTACSRPLSLYGWDCESVLIMNPNTIEEIK